ncbi:radiation sensitive protein rad9 [Ciborinia camelliae]|nr:radiation sensitive protein rad9 [Ciborinia camelliae]
MFRTKAKAEQAALIGEGPEEFDTQQCRELQEAIISSSPERSAAADSMPILPVASSALNFNATNNDRKPAGDEENDSQAQEAFPEIETARTSEINSLNPLIRNPVQTNNGLPLHSDYSSRKFKSRTAKKDDESKLRAFDINGKPLPFTRPTVRAMEEKELTQENSASVYEGLDIHRSRNQDVEGCDAEFSSSPPIPIERDSKSELQPDGISGDPSKLPNSIHTWSTARTYEENDTGHINFDGFEPISAPDEDHFESQDPPAVPTATDFIQEPHFEPQTPAPPVNPFSEKGSVMKEDELFGATQPSSIGLLGCSPTSSRPSPDVYNGFGYPQEVEPSPLVRRSEAANAISPGAVRSLVRSLSPDTPVSATSAASVTKVQSFNSGPRKSTFVREPQNTYISMKESQEKRRKLIHPEVSSGSESESDIEPISKKHKKAEIERKVLEETALIGLRRPNSFNRPNSAKDSRHIQCTASRPPRTRNHQRSSSELTSTHTPKASESTPTTVEVPASGRRRSMEEDYVAQCEGFDARDTQPTQQDMIADSQAAPVSSNVVTASSPVAGPRKRALPPTDVEESGAEPTSPSQRLPKQVQQPASSVTVQIAGNIIMNNTEGIQCMDSNAPAPSDQDQTKSSNEMATDSNAFTVPVAIMQDLLSDGVASTVPETSPAIDRLKPMTEIADISFGVANDDQYDDLPGFGEDTEFNEVIGLSNPQTPKRQPHFQFSVATTPSPINLVPTGSAAIVSSDLSSAPSTMEPPTPFAENPITPEVRNSSETESADHNSREEEQPSDLTLPPKADSKKDLSPLPSIEHDAERYQRTLTEEPHLPPKNKRRRESLPRSPPQKSTRISKNQSKKQTYSKPQTKTTRNTRLSSVSSIASTPLPSTGEPDMVSASNSSTNSRPRRNGAAKAKKTIEETPLPVAKGGRPRRSLVPSEKEGTMSTPPSNQKSSLPPHEDSEDPLALSISPLRTVLNSKKSIGNLFNDMAFAVSYVGGEKDKEAATWLIKRHGGRILDDGFETLFTPLVSPSKSRPAENEIGETELEVVSSETNLGFVALIADEHSRKAKYMQALALGLPCISGRWVSDCVDMGTIIDWLPYLLCAGQSSFLGAFKSRYLRPYPATDAHLNETFAERSKLLEGKSILIVTGKGKAGENRKPYTFLTRALGPTRLGQAQDLNHARKMLLDAESKNSDYDWLYVDGKQDMEAVEAAVFKNTPISTAKGSRKRKLASGQGDDVAAPLPKRIRVVNDEVIIQSLILGQLIKD